MDEGNSGIRLSKAEKLAPEQVLDIRAKWNTGKWTQFRLAKEFDVTLLTIHKIVRRKSWRDI